MNPSEYFEGISDLAELVTVTRTDDGQIFIDCRGLADVEGVENVEINGDRNETFGLESVPPVEEFDVDDVEFNRYSVFSDGHDVSIPTVYRRQLRDRGYLSYLPTVRERSDGTYEVLNGRRRIDIGRDLGLDSIAVHTREMSDWEYARAWIRLHFPPTDVEETMWLYTEDEQREAIELLKEDWSEDELERIDRLGPVLDSESA